MKRLTLWMVRRYLPGYLLLGTVDIAVIRKLLAEYAPGHHIHRSPPKGARKSKREAMIESHKAAIEEYYENPEAETLGD